MSQATVSGAVQRILPRHFQIIDMAVAGHDNKTIAQTTGSSIGQVNLILRSPVAQSEIARRRKESSEATILGLDRSAILGKARSILDQATEHAAVTLENELLADKPEVRIKAANSILDRALGGGKDDRRASVVNVTAEQIQLINLALKESQDVYSLLPANQASADTPELGSSEVHGDRSGGTLDEGGRVHSDTADCSGERSGDVPQASDGVSSES